MLWVLVLLFAFTGLVAIRSYRLHNAIVLTAACHDCRWSLEAPAYDAGIFALLMLLLGVAGMLPLWARFITAIAGGLVLLLFSTDIFVSGLLNIRLKITDIIKDLSVNYVNSSLSRP